MILNIETATKNCSVSISKNGEIIFFRELNDGNYSHAEKLHSFILETVKKAEVLMADIEAVAVSKGPGSYTGLRIGVSAAKGLCFALGVPLISIETLTSLAHKVKKADGVIVAMLDARRMEVYSAVFDENHVQVRETMAEIIDEASFMEYLIKGKVYFVGDGVDKCKEIIQHQNAVFIEGEFPSSKEMGGLAEMKHQKNDIEDVAYFEPYYLKDFIVTKSKKRF